MVENLTHIFNRINTIKSAPNRLRELKKPAMVKEFEQLYRQAFSKKEETQPANQEMPIDQNAASLAAQKKPLQTTFESNCLSNLTLKSVNDQDELKSNLISQAIQKASQKYKISEDVIRAVIQTESAFDPEAVSQAGAMGLMQLMPLTALKLGVNQPWDIEQNINAGTKYLRKMLDRYHGNLDKALAAYNAGPTRVDQANGIPDIKETQNYVRKIKNKLLK